MESFDELTTKAILSNDSRLSCFLERLIVALEKAIKVTKQ